MAGGLFFDHVALPIVAVSASGFTRWLLWH
jgi:hypothetical protein